MNIVGFYFVKFLCNSKIRLSRWLELIHNCCLGTAFIAKQSNTVLCTWFKSLFEIYIFPYGKTVGGNKDYHYLDTSFHQAVPSSKAWQLLLLPSPTHPLWLMNYVAHKASWQISESILYSPLTSIHDSSSCLLKKPCICLISGNLVPEQLIL